MGESRNHTLVLAGMGHYYPQSAKTDNGSDCCVTVLTSTHSGCILADADYTKMYPHHERLAAVQTQMTSEKNLQHRSAHHRRTSLPDAPSRSLENTSIRQYDPTVVSHSIYIVCTI